MFKKFTNACVRLMNRWLPDPFLFAILLTIVVFIAAMIGTGMGPIQMVWAWGGKGGTGSGFWNLLSFSMQMALVLVLGSAMASAKICKKILGAIASLAKDKRSAILIVTFVSTICCWLNWVQARENYQKCLDVIVENDYKAMGVDAGKKGTKPPNRQQSPV